MSGIAGTYHLDGRPAGAAELSRMTETLAHRGPDGINHRCEGLVGLAHLMLHATPEALHETLPLTDASGRFTITADARIDNRADLIGRLGVNGKPTEEIADSELILAAYKKWGADCPDRLLGAFAFAVWDERERRLFCARDHYGLKPLFYYHAPGRLFAFASEVKALLALEGVPQRLNETRVADHLLMPVSKDPAITFYEGVRSLAPAHTASVHAGDADVKQHRYWRLDPDREIRLDSDEEYAEALREIFVEAVRCRLRSPRPVATMLSGGLDSSSIASTAAHLRQTGDGGGAPGPLHALSAVFDDVTECDERPFIEAVLSEYDGFAPHAFVADQTSPLTEVGRRTRAFDRAIKGGNGYIPWHLYDVASRRGARVVLSGFDGDTAVSHGRKYLVELAEAGRWIRLAREAKAYAQRMDQDWPPVVWAWLKRYAVDPAVNRYRPLRFARRAWRGGVRRLRPARDDTDATPAVGQRAWRRVLSPAFLARVEAHREAPPALPTTEREHHHRILTRALMPRTIESLEASAAAHGMDLRLPFFDRRVIEFCLALPPEQKMQNGWTRLVMRRAMKGLLPEKVRWRPQKSNIGPSFDHGLLKYETDRLTAMVRDNTGDVARFVDLDVLEEALGNFASGQIKQGQALLLWRALSLALWLEQNRRCDGASANGGSREATGQPTTFA
jgi:asparagine synthase (glutamine-hydrolysing)